MKIISINVFLLVVISCLFQWCAYVQVVDAKNLNELMAKVGSDSISNDRMSGSGNKGQANMDLHSHAKKALPNGMAKPQLDLRLFVDSKSGYNLHILYDGFELESPEFLDKPEGVIEGHAHLFINGKKIQRIYGAYLHLNSGLFNPGVNSISVTLNSHQHDTWSIDGKPIVATYFINTTGVSLIQHYFSAFPISSAFY